MKRAGRRKANSSSRSSPDNSGWPSLCPISAASAAFLSTFSHSLITLSSAPAPTALRLARATVDALLSAIEAGASAVVQPGGSMRDDDVIKAADENGLAMVFTGMRHFRH